MMILFMLTFHIDRPLSTSKEPCFCRARRARRRVHFSELFSCDVCKSLSIYTGLFSHEKSPVFAELVEREDALFVQDDYFVHDDFFP